MDKDQLIYNYLNNKLNFEEKQFFEKLLEQDSSFKEEVDFQEGLKQAIRANQRDEIKKELQLLDTKKFFLKKHHHWAIAASIIFLIFLGSYTFFKKDDVSHQDLFVANFEPYQNVLHVVIRGKADESLIDKSFLYYENNDFVHFLKLMNQVKPISSDDDFYVAIAYLKLGETKKSITILNEYLTTRNARFKQQSYWYLALAYLKTDQINAAKKALKEVSKSPDFKQKEAVKLIKQLD